MDKINSRSPFYLEVDGGEPTPAPQTIPISCGGTHNVATDVGIVTYQVETPEIGTFRVDIAGSNVPAKFTLKWNGNESTTDYIGLDAYDQDLLDAGVPQGEIFTGDPSTKADSFVEITKSTAQPELVELVVNAPLINDEYTVDFTCPVSPPVVITQTTQINIWFDASGSMNSTLAPLESMAAGNLKDCLVQFYNDDPLEYDKYVNVIPWGYQGQLSNINEQTFNVGAFEPDVVGATNVINIVFQDEANNIYLNSETTFNPSLQTQAFRDDIANLRDKLTNYSSDYITPIVFQVEYQYGTGSFKPFLQTVENGGALGGPYDSPNNLSDLTGQFKFYYDVQAGVSYASNPTYYRDLIIQAINDLGFSITCAP